MSTQTNKLESLKRTNTSTHKTNKRPQKSNTRSQKTNMRALKEETRAPKNQYENPNDSTLRSMATWASSWTATEPSARTGADVLHGAVAADAAAVAAERLQHRGAGAEVPPI